MGSTQATIVVSFGNESLSGGFYIAEIDDKGNEEALGKTSGFVPNDPVAFIIQHDNTMKIEKITTTNGSISGPSLVTRTKTVNLVFATIDDDQSAPCLGTLNMGSPVYGSVSLKSSMDSSKSVSILVESGSFPAVYNASVTGPFQQYVLNPNIPPLAADETFDVYIFIYFGAA